MKHNITKALLLMLVILANQSLSAFGDTTIFIPRSQSVNAARDLIGWQRDINQFEAGDYYWTSAVTLQYDRTFKPERINNYLFGGSCMTFTGSRVATRDANTDILADYFGLPADFDSTVVFAPRITNTIVDFANYVGLDRVWKGLYIRWHTPLVHTKWNINMTENIVNSGKDYLQSNDQTAGYHLAGYMGPNRVTRNELAPSAIEAWCHPVAYGDMQSPMKFGKLCNCCSEKDMFGDTEIAFGWNFLQDTWYHAGLNLRATLPISDRYQVEYLFQPQIGNGHHTAFGIGWTSHVDVWESSDAEHRIAVYLDANVMHLNSVTQFRSYDLVNGPGSRYMLLEEFGPYTQRLADEFAPPPYLVYAKNLLPAINVTTLCSSIRINAEADFALKFSYFRRDGLGIDVGYNLWTRSPEKLTCREKLEANKYGIKGDAMVYGFNNFSNDAYVLSATESLATIHGGPNGANNFTDTIGAQPIASIAANGTIDNLNATNSGNGRKSISPIDAQAFFGQGNSSSISHTSIQPVLLTDADINEASALAPRFISHKFFAHIDYRWEDTESATPFVGFGGQVEVAKTCALNEAGYAQGTFWVKGGFSY